MNCSVEIHALIALGRAVRDRIIASRAQATDWTSVADHAVSDLQYGIDRFSETGLVEAVQQHCATLGPLRLMSEGLPAAGIAIGVGTPRWLLILDPIDGTRGLMHDKRSAFFLAGLAPANDARLSTLRHAVMLELPTTRSELSDILAADAGGPLHAWTDDLRSGVCTPFAPKPSQATDLRHGFASVVRFFSGAAERLGAFHDALLVALHPSDAQARQDAFEDQYISNGGQMHALITGRDRFIADLRPLAAAATGVPLRCAHPYDLLGVLVARAAGVEITAPSGAPIDAPLDLTTPVAWIGYANAALRSNVEPAVQHALGVSGLSTPHNASPPL
ncbi:MAG: inositol monophosphatase [Planctomycetes bacterium]|nr:inositol monophosphatase [Planctomycetota bacterium]